MVIKHGTSIQGSEQTGTEEAQIQAARKFGQMASNAGALGVAAVTAGAGLIKDALKRRKEQMATEPELRGDLYKDLEEAFRGVGLEAEEAAEAAADLVQNGDAESSSAISKAHHLVEQDEPTSSDRSELRGVEASSAKPLEARPIILDSKLPTTAEVIAPKQGVEFSKKPSEMKWPELQKTARAITDETGQKPASSKKVDVEPFVTEYWKKQQAELTHESQAIASPPIIRVPIQKADAQTSEGLSADLSAELEARGADSAIAAEAGPALVKSQDAKTNLAIAEANSQVKRVVERSRLHQTYYNVLAKQKILSSQMTELASKDLAAGKGAHSSPYVREAFDKILDKELERSGLDPAAQKWSKYSRHVTEQDPIKRDHLIATAAIKDGVSAKDAKAIIRWNSPVAAGINQKDGGTAMANYADKVVSNLKNISRGVQAKAGKNMAPIQKKKVGIEV
jgi:hypothetical protein